MAGRETSSGGFGLAPAALAKLGADVAPVTSAQFDGYVAKEMGVIKELVKIPTN